MLAFIVSELRRGSVAAAMAFRWAPVLSGQTTIVRDTQRFCGSARFDFVLSWPGAKVLLVSSALAPGPKRGPKRMGWAQATGERDVVLGLRGISN